MRVLLIAPPWFPVPPESYGGIEAVVALLADGLVEAGHEVELLASGGSVSRAALRSVYAVAPSGKLGDTPTELVHVLEGYARRSEFDVVHDHSGVVGAALAWAASDRPTVHTLHGPWRPRIADVYRHVGRKVSLVTVSHDQARRAPEGVSVPHVVHNAVDLQVHAPGSQPREDFLLYVGRSNRQKGPEVAAEVARRLGRPMVMLLKVNEATERDYFERVVRPAVACANVDVRVGATVHEKVALMRRTSCVVFPAQWPEPFGLVPAEANACGAPVAAFASGAVPEVVQDHVSGVLAPADDVDALCAAVERAQTIPTEDCRRHAEAHFAPATMVRRYEQIYQAALAGFAPTDPASSASPSAFPITPGHLRSGLPGAFHRSG